MSHFSATVVKCAKVVVNFATTRLVWCYFLRITTKIVTFRKFKLLTAIFGMISCA